jgi:hypothetical protein
VPRYDLSRAVWRTSSYSGQNGDCVEVADNIPSLVVVRDSKDRDGLLLLIDPEEWRGFTEQVKAEQFDPR